MKNFIRTLVLVALAFITSASFAAQSVHLMLKGSGGKVYACKSDASGKFSFSKVEPGTYQLVWVLPDGTTPDNTESCAIEVESFSWGATNMGTGGHGGGGGAGRVSSTSTGAVDSDDDNDGVSESSKVTKSRSNIQNNRTVNTTRSNIKRKASEFQSTTGGKYCVVVLEDVVISGLTDCPGTISGMAINEKGLPGEKGTKKGNK